MEAVAVEFVLEVAYHNDVPVQLLRTKVDIDRFVTELLAADPFSVLPAFTPLMRSPVRTRTTR